MFQFWKTYSTFFITAKTIFAFFYRSFKILRQFTVSHRKNSDFKMCFLFLSLFISYKGLSIVKISNRSIQLSQAK